MRPLRKSLPWRSPSSCSPESLVAGDLVLSNIAANKLYIVNEVVFWGVALQFAKADEDNVLGMHEDDYLGSVLTVSCDAFALKTVPEKHTYGQIGDGKVVKGAFGPVFLDDEDHSGADLKGALDVRLGDLVLDHDDDGIYDYGPWATDKGVSAYFFGQSVVKGKGALTAKVELETLLEDRDLFIYDGLDLLYKVGYATTGLHGFDGYVVQDEEENKVGFEVDDGDVLAIYVALSDPEDTDLTGDFQEVEFKKLVSGGGSVVNVIGEFEDEDFTAAKKVYEGVMKFFGFNYDAEGKLRDKHFEAKDSNLFLKDQIAINLYTGSIVLPNGPEVPKTGDAASIMGFVMIALALVAAGFVVSRKVRA